MHRWPSVETSPRQHHGPPNPQADLERPRLRRVRAFPEYEERHDTCQRQPPRPSIGFEDGAQIDEVAPMCPRARRGRPVEQGSSNVVSGFAGCVPGISQSVCLRAPRRQPRSRPFWGDGGPRVRGGCGHGCLKPGRVRLPNRPGGMLRSEVRLSRTDSKWLTLVAVDVRPGWRICHCVFCRMRSRGLASWTRECGNRIHGIGVEWPGPPMRFVRTRDRCNTDARRGRTGRLAEGSSHTFRGNCAVEGNIPRSPDRPPIVMNLAARAAPRSP